VEGLGLAAGDLAVGVDVGMVDAGVDAGMDAEMDAGVDLGVYVGVYEGVDVPLAPHRPFCPRLLLRGRAASSRFTMTTGSSTGSGEGSRAARAWRP